jgi:hypothetical protein
MPPPEDVPGVAMPPAGRGGVAPPLTGVAGFGAMDVAMAGWTTGRGAG